MDLDECILLERPFEQVRTDEQAALVDEQRVGEQDQLTVSRRLKSRGCPPAASVRLAAGPPRTPRLRRVADELGHLRMQVVERVEAHVGPHGF